MRVPTSLSTTLDLTPYGRSPPNMTKILYRWGLQPLLERFTHKCKIMTFRNGKYNPNFFEQLLTGMTTSGGTGQLIGSIGMDKDFLEDLLAEFLFIQVRGTSISPVTIFTMSPSNSMKTFVTFSFPWCWRKGLISHSKQRC